MTFTRPSQRIRGTGLESGGATFAKFSARLTTLGILFSGLWVLFQFSYAKWIEPRLSAAVVHVSSDAKYVKSLPCCHLYEVRTKLENKGHRNVVLHASHQSVGARRLLISKGLTDSRVEEIMGEFLLSRRPSESSTYMKSNTVDYLFPQERSTYLLISAGNLSKPGIQLAPGESHLNQSIAVIPKDHDTISIKGMVFFSHFDREDLDWRWTLNDETLEPHALPWKKKHTAELLRLTQCAVDQDGGASACKALLINESERTFREVWAADPYSYSQHYGIDVVVNPSKEK